MTSLGEDVWCLSLAYPAHLWKGKIWNARVPKEAKIGGVLHFPWSMIWNW